MATTGAITATTDTTAAAAAMKKSIGMNKDDFLKLFITQLQNQDPLKPQDPDAFLGELAQLTQVEQSYNSTTALQNLLAAQNSNAAMSSVAFIGKTVVANGNSFSFDGSNPASLSFNLPSSVDSAKVEVYNANGNAVAAINTAALTQGDRSILFDGKDSTGAMLPAGEYYFAITGKTATGADVAATTYTSGIVDGVSIVNNSPILTIGRTSAALSDVLKIKGV